MEQLDYLDLSQTNQNEEQLLFTYTDSKGVANKPLYNDYLNTRMRSIMGRNPHLSYATPHKLRHTGATLAKQAGSSVEAISEALTHSDSAVTKGYINTPNVIPMSVGEIAYRQTQNQS